MKIIVGVIKYAVRFHQQNDMKFTYVQFTAQMNRLDDTFVSPHTIINLPFI